jgi:mRNA-degrading endonuclease RelE of RelBE toxin-antitoxin system
MKIASTSFFVKELKPLVKKYRSLEDDLLELAESLNENPLQGDALSHNCFKVRLAISSKNKGKSGGARVITNIHVKDEVIYLISIYDKSNQDSITEKELLNRLKALDLL